MMPGLFVSFLTFVMSYILRGHQSSPSAPLRCYHLCPEVHQSLAWINSGSLQTSDLFWPAHPRSFLVNSQNSSQSAYVKL